MRKTSSFLMASIILMMVSCQNREPMTPISKFERTQMLEHWVDDIILPSLEAFGTKALDLKSAAERFTDNPSEASLVDVRMAWYEAYLSWQRVGMFADIWKSRQIKYKWKINLFPVDTAFIERVIAEGNYDLSTDLCLRFRGLPAVDYMLSGLGETDTQILGHYTTDPNADGYRTYLNNLVAPIHTLTQGIIKDWKEEYRETFVHETGNNPGSSIPIAVNDFIHYCNVDLNALKIGLPAGLYSFTPRPNYIEGLHKGDISKQLILESLDALQTFFNGTSKDDSDPSLYDYLDHLDVRKDNIHLGDLINAQFNASQKAINKLNDDIRIDITQNSQHLHVAFTHLKELHVLLKIDMMQALGINNDFPDSCSDGD